MTEKMLDAHEYQKLCKRTECDQWAARFRYMSSGSAEKDLMLPIRLNHGVIGLTGEVGELASLIERWLHYGKPLDLLSLKDELGDCLWYIALMCNACGFSLLDIMESNINKLMERYPERYSAERALNRDLEKERAAVAKTSSFDEVDNWNNPNVPPADRSRS